LRILHLSDDGLPDWRIEKSALTASRLGHEVVFAGGKNHINYSRRTFPQTYEVNWTPNARRAIPSHWHPVKKQLEKVIKAVKPDIVHAHNIFSAKMISEFGLHYIYDDHEYWPVYLKRQIESAKSNQNTSVKSTKTSLPRNIARTLATKLLDSLYVSLWTNWEKELVSSSYTIVTTDKVAEELKIICNCGRTNRIFVVPNFPSIQETKDLEMPRFHPRLGCVYAGKEAEDNIVLPHRNMEGLIDLFVNKDIGYLTLLGIKGESSAKVQYMGFLERHEMYKEMANNSIGLAPMKRHWSHAYLSPNKIYEYVLAGLFVIFTSSFEQVLKTLRGNCATFNDYNDLTSQLEYFKNNLEELHKMRIRTFEFARENLIWEKYEKNILQVYQRC
jgi:glycosyltransferase involved in cell wall biosynthesis